MEKTRFIFLDRVVNLEFFDEEPIKITMLISDETDRKFQQCAQALGVADRGAEENRASAYEAALADLIGKDHAERILSRADVRDCVAVSNVIVYITNRYNEEKVKKLRGSAH